MTIPAVDRVAGPFAGDGVTTTYPFTFKVFDQDDISVVRADVDGVETTLVRGGGYTVSLNGDQDVNPGGTVTLTAPLPTNYRLAIQGGVPYDQPMSLPDGGMFNPHVIEEAFDRLAIQIQQNKSVLERTARVQVTSTASVEALSDAIVDLVGLGPELTAVAGVASYLPTVAGISGDIAAVGLIAGDVITVAGIASDVTTVVGNATNINKVASIDTAVTAVAAIDTDVTTVSGMGAAITTVNANATNVNKVAAIDTAVTAVAAIDTNVATVAGISGDVTTVAGIKADIQAVPAQVQLAEDWAIKLGGTVDGVEFSAKYWAQQAAAAGQLSDTTPQAPGTASPGTGTKSSREDHVHPMPSAADVGAVPTSRTVNGKALSSNISINAADVGARADNWVPSGAQVAAFDNPPQGTFLRSDGSWVRPHYDAFGDII